MSKQGYLDIQWDTSDVCMTLVCSCGDETHFDIPGLEGPVECVACKKSYILPREIKLKKDWVAFGPPGHEEYR